MDPTESHGNKINTLRNKYFYLSPVILLKKFHKGSFEVFWLKGEVHWNFKHPYEILQVLKNILLGSELNMQYMDEASNWDMAPIYWYTNPSWFYYYKQTQVLTQVRISMLFSS